PHPRRVLRAGDPGGDGEWAPDRRHRGRGHTGDGAAGSQRLLGAAFRPGRAGGRPRPAGSRPGAARGVGRRQPGDRPPGARRDGQRGPHPGPAPGRGRPGRRSPGREGGRVSRPRPDFPWKADRAVPRLAALIVRNTLLLFAAQAVSWCLGLLSMWIIPRSVGAAEWGEWTLAWALTAVATSVCALGLD